MENLFARGRDIVYFKMGVLIEAKEEDTDIILETGEMVFLIFF